jgi:hypothetical protein
MIRIKSQKANFRRCGMAHPASWTEYPDDKFTKVELAVLKAEPMLQIQEVKDPPAAAKRAE